MISPLSNISNDRQQVSLAPDLLGPTICIGEILVEIVATSVGDGFLEPQPLIGPYPSGAPAIFIDQCARMGGSAALVGAVGADEFGTLCCQRLADDGVDISAIAQHLELPTGSAFVRYRADGERDFVFNMWTSAAGAIDWTDQVDALVQRAGHLHVMGTLLVRADIWPLIERAATIISARGGSVSLDPNLRKELKADSGASTRFSQMIDCTHLLLPSGDELIDAAGGGTRDEAIANLFERGVREIVLKEGANGATVFAPGVPPVHAAAFNVAEIDPTGAGDCFGGAYLACRRLGMSIEDTLTYACAAGARNVTVRGPMEGAGTRAQLDTFIAETERHQ